MLKYTFIILSFFVILSTSSCKRHRMHKKEVALAADTLQSETVKAEKPVLTVEEPAKVEIPVVQKIEVKPAEIDFKYLNIKSKVNFSGGGEEQSFPVNIHIKKDSIIWLSIVVGLEGGRGIITKDSVIFLDRLHRTYYKYDFASLSKQFNFNLNYDLVQSILIGNMPIRKRESDEVLKQENGFLIKQKEGFVLIDNLVSEANLKLQKVNASDETGDSKMEIDYTNFLPITDLLIPQEVKAKIDAKKDGKVLQTSVNLQHNKIEVLDQSPGFSFSIPKSYTPK
ncbi:hypothetical protein Emtol_1637 [Emticicia oligotrophica DSM 17448]|uniref:DUF4292 domain-containing protein n=1 Tax=Emticicia oligotrophica (strain DSM 17448 / CIP 109782 / MTCC 6937 / GPTSA100-15) TaxID=929562 RepID=A0ABN4AKG9_EMTOG|nr:MULTISPECIES: DUF4292 domain-containing protein [Emticicia]AFK02782.1 hypothetical protein Emtol_1637 [Emticicia oligotrophica DSM 17448]